MVRTTEFGSPFRNQNSGVDENKDKENQSRWKLGMQTFMKSAQGSFFFS